MHIRRSLKTSTLLTIAGVLLAACNSTKDGNEEESMPSYERLRGTVTEHSTGAIFSPGITLGLYEDVKARRVGDILTVVLLEETSGENSMDNNIETSTELNLDTPIFGGNSEPDFNYEVAGGNTFSGQSGSSQSNRLSGSISVTVHEVLPNGNLVIEGEKWIRINKANEYIKLQGVVRSKDINTFNTLYSTQVADARISYGGSGTNSQSNAPGWVSRILFSPVWPF